VKMFSHLIYFVNRVHKFVTFSAIWKDSAATNCDTVHTKKVHPRR
jgi:hypothetical protein